MQSVDDVNYVNVCLNVVIDVVKVVDIQGMYNVVFGKYGLIVMSMMVVVQQDLLNYVQVSVCVSGGYLQMLYVNCQVDEQQKNYDVM